MPKKITITISDWLLKIINEKKDKKNRSEYITELCVKGLGLDEVLNNERKR